MKKNYLFGIIGFLAIGLVTAGYLVNSFTIQTDVIEPFTVEYAIIGDAGNWDGVTTCDDEGLSWQTGTDVDVGGLYAGEGRVVCVKIDNAGEGDIDYTFSGEVVSGNGNLAECVEAFGNPSVTGTASGSSTTINGVVVMISGDATPVEDCEITLSTTRG